MKVTYLGQGFDAVSENSVGSKLIEHLESGNFDSFFAISAFASAAAINGLGEHLRRARRQFESLNIIVGIDQNGTSKEALEEIEKLGINGYVFYQREPPIFHPKIYLFEGATQTVLILGSSNLTATGLFSNVESSLMVEFQNGDQAGIDLIGEIKSYFSTIFALNDQNLFRIDRATINDFVARGVVPNETKRIMYQAKTLHTGGTEALIPVRPTSRIPAEFRRSRKTNSATEAKLVETSELGVEAVVEVGRIVWERRRLPASSVQAAGAGTNPTGGLRLVQDGFLVDGVVINQTTYFRNEVFGGLDWTAIREAPYVEGTSARFSVMVNSEDWGLHTLDIRHKPSGEANQHNYTTSISWGALSERIRNANLVNSRLRLFAPNGNDLPFIIQVF